MSPRQDFLTFLNARWEWSTETFGRGKRTLGILRHIQKELVEVQETPEDLDEWIDIINLALDGYARHGGRAELLVERLWLKLEICKARTYPYPTSDDEPSEHLR